MNTSDYANECWPSLKRRGGIVSERQVHSSNYFQISAFQHLSDSSVSPFAFSSAQLPVIIDARQAKRRRGGHSPLASGSNSDQNKETANSEEAGEFPCHSCRAVFNQMYHLNEHKRVCLGEDDWGERDEMKQPPSPIGGGEFRQIF